VATVFENLDAGLTAEEVMEEFDVVGEEINALLEFVAESLRAPFPAAAHSGRRASVGARTLSL
jgi:hypothetical protein